MKKSLVLAMAMAMGVTASAYAANPFSDVPAGHWAYDSISQLAGAGVIDGYDDATFGGEKLMTRFEMAQIVAKAMAKGANCDKLAAEFADELDNLGVRVAKLEKKVDNVKITGQIRYSYRDNVGGKGFKLDSNDGVSSKTSGRKGKGYNRFRTRLFVNGAINNNWKYTGMLENDRYLDVNHSTADDVKLKRAFLNGRVGGVKVEAGRCYFLQGDMIDANGDGVKASYNFDKVNLTGWVMKNLESLNVNGRSKEMNGWSAPLRDSDRFYMLKADTKFEKLDVFVQYWKEDAKIDTWGFGKSHNTEIYELGLAYPVAKDLILSGQYYYGKSDYLNAEFYEGDKNGYELGLKYRGAKAAVPGTWGIWATYSDRPLSTYMKPTCFNTYAYNEYAWLDTDGYTGFEIGANYTLVKNIVAALRYFDYKGRDNYEKRWDNGSGKGKRQTLWGEVVFSF